MKHQKQSLWCGKRGFPRRL